MTLPSLAMLDADSDRIDRLDLKMRVGALIDQLLEKGVYLHIPRQDRDYEIDVGLRMLTLRKIVTQQPDGQLIIVEKNRPLLAYYANAVRHLV